MARKKICKYCNKIVDDNHKCLSDKRTQYNKYKREYYQNNKEIVAPLMSRRWRSFRKTIIHRDSNLCQRCFRKYNIINGDSLEVHHIKPRIDYPELMYDELNVVTLCKTCNLQLGTNGIDFKWEAPETNFKM